MSREDHGPQAATRSLDPARLQELVRRSVETVHPLRIILFGSYAYGTPGAGSDVDLLVILPFTGRETAKSVEMLNRVEPTFPVELLVRTPEEIRQRLAWNDYFLREVMERGRTLYAASDGRVGGHHVETPGSAIPRGTLFWRARPAR